MSMKRVYKFLQRQFSNIGNLINWFILFITRDNFKSAINNDKNNKELRIIVNGPSFALEKAISEDKNVEYCMVNQACLTPEFEVLKPSVYIMADPGYVDSNDAESMRAWEKLSKGVGWDMTVYLPYYMYKMVRANFRPSGGVKISFYHSANFQGWDSVAFRLYKKNWAIPGAGNVLVPSIYVGILKGYSLIRLYGSDHSWTEQLSVNDKNQVCVKQLHYYDNEETVSLTPWNDEVGSPFSMSRIMKRFADVFAQYEVIERFAKWSGVRILNMSNKSFIDAFEKSNN